MSFFGEVNMASLNTLSKKDLLSLLEIAHDLSAVQNTAEFMQCYTKTKSLLLFDGCFALYLDKEAVDKSQPPVFNYQAMDFPAEFLEKYIKKQVYLKCPVTKMLLKTWEAQNWKTTLSRAWEKGHMQSRSFCRLYDYMDGWSHGCRHLRQNTLSIFTIAGRKVENDARTRVILENLVPHFAESLKRISHRELVARRNKKTLKITPREIEILKWLSCGKSTWDISVILKRSERVIFWHVDNLMKKLDAVNRTQAVAKAMQRGLID